MTDSEAFYDYWLVGDGPYLRLGDIVEIEYKREEGDIPTFDYAVTSIRFTPSPVTLIFTVLQGDKLGAEVPVDSVKDVAKKFVRVSREYAEQKSVIGSDGLNETEREYMAREYEANIKPTDAQAKAFSDWLARKMKEKND